MTLSAPPPDSPLRADIEEINSAGQRAAALTRQLLAFSRKQVLEPRVIDLNVLVRNVDTLIRRMIRDDITVVHSLSDTLAACAPTPHSSTR